MEEEIQNKNMAEDSFKVPILPNLGNKVKTEEEQSKAPDPSPPVSFKSPAEMLKERSEPPPTIDYSEPTWGGKAPPGESKFYIEELKNGTIVKEHKLTDKSYFVIGRFRTCDIRLEHPSLSRFHSILQYKSEGTPDKPVGFYLYDLGSTHGSYHLKNKCFPKTYYRVRVGHVLKFGGSTRLLILQGPAEDMEEESEMTVTELQEKAKEKTRIREEMEKAKKEKEESEELNSGGGINWGFAEDATEEELPDMSKNPFSLDSAGGTKNEDLNLEDPKKTLRGWFEREGYELEYDCKENGYATFTCTVSLPINEILGSGGAPIIAEATVKGGKKKEAVIQCALEACRILDNYGILRQGSHESRAKKQAKKWKDDDYYDSDEDEFLDRTGNIAEKRNKRMKMDGELSKNTEVETYESLQDKHNKMKEKICETELDLKEQIEALSEAKKMQKDDGDDLDSFMDNLKKIENSGGKEKVSKMKQLLLTQQKELRRIEQLMNLAKPTQMPKLAIGKSGTKGVMIGKRWGLGTSKSLRTIKPIDATKSDNENLEKVPEQKSTAKGQTKSKEKEQTLQSITDVPVAVPEEPEELSSKPAEIKDIADESSIQSTEEQKSEQKKKRRKHQKPALKYSDIAKTALNDETKVPGEYDTSDEKYATWMPPSNQDGSGRTSLNDKLGY